MTFLIVLFMEYKLQEGNPKAREFWSFMKTT